MNLRMMLAFFAAILACPLAALAQSPVRTLPACYTAGTAFNVTISVTLNNAPGWGAQENVPQGWTVTNVNNGGNYIPAQSRINWLSLSATTGTVTLTYTIAPPAGTTGSGSFIGEFSVNGVNQTIGGAGSIAACAATPSITGLNPNNGPLAGGTAVTISGSNFTGATAVSFGGSAAVFTVSSATQISATAPARGTAGSVNVTVTTPAGTSNAVPYTYNAPTAPTLSGINPNNGPLAGGTNVTLTGSNLTGATAVRFGANAANSFTVNSATQISAVSPAGASAGAVNVTVVGPGGTSNGVQFTYNAAAPSLSGINPGSGPLAGGTSITLTGTNLSGATAVSIGGTAASSFAVNSNTQVTAVTPARGTAGAVNVTVTTPAGTSNAVQFTYNAGGSVSPVRALPACYTPGTGLNVTITATLSNAPGWGAQETVPSGWTVTNISNGGNFVPAQSRINWLSLANTTGVVTLTYTATPPAGTTGTANFAGQFSVNGVDENIGGVSSIASCVNTPQITAINPNNGPLAGGTAVTLTGSNFTGATQVAFSGVTATFTVNSATQIVATSPAGAAAGPVNVRVTAPGGTSNAVQFTYNAPAAPTLSAVNPNAGPVAGGTTVQLTGTNLSGATSVSFGGNAATNFTVNSATQITAVAPPRGSAGAVSVTVTTPSGTSNGVQFTYTASPVPSISSISPASGPMAGGTSVIITGANFAGATSVTFGGADAAGFTVNSATRITATTPARGSAGVVGVTVRTPAGTSNAVSFTYVGTNPPVLSSISPTSGGLAGGTNVVINGSSLLGVTSLTFGGTPAQSFTVNSNTQISAVTPARGSAGVVSVIASAGGTASNALQFTYTSPQRPPNDDFVNRISLTGLPVSTIGSNVNATEQTGEQGSGSSSVWWVWTAPESGCVEFDTTGSAFNAVVSIFTGSSLTGLSAVAEGTRSVNVSASAGTRYTIRVASASGAEGAIALAISSCGGDSCGDISVTPSQAIFDSNGGSFSVRVQTDSACGWSIQSRPSWIQAASFGGTGTGDLSLVCQQNGGDGRVGMIVLALDDNPLVTATVTVSQDAVNDPVCGCAAKSLSGPASMAGDSAVYAAVGLLLSLSHLMFRRRLQTV